MGTEQRIDEISKRLKNAKGRLRRATGCDGRSELRRRQLSGLVEHLEEGLRTYREILRQERAFPHWQPERGPQI